MTTLAMYVIGPDHLAAVDEDDAWWLWCGHHNESRDNYPDEPARLVPDDRMFSVFVESEQGSISDSGMTIKLSAHNWVTREGRGFLFSSEY